ncbi:hypothetical protein [Frondihabitans sp. PAMC 28766]|uniref:hypothetical protein n=1 Tax=Frondihabitans sp. PAMC 28766 TaxID=1795630 RepID=UPI0012FF8C4B|nr:hypothetical protein [Frondihabitans sp. PAMC 28766]
MSAIASPSIAHLQRTSPVARPSSGLSRADPANIDLPGTEPIDITSMMQLLLDRGI